MYTVQMSSFYCYMLQYMLRPKTKELNFFSLHHYFEWREAILLLIETLLYKMRLTQRETLENITELQAVRIQTKVDHGQLTKYPNPHDPLIITYVLYVVGEPAGDFWCVGRNWRFPRVWVGEFNTLLSFWPSSDDCCCNWRNAQLLLVHQLANRTLIL